MKSIAVLLSLLIITSCNSSDEIATIKLLEKRPNSQIEVGNKNFQSLVIKSKGLIDTLKVGYLYGEPGYKLIQQKKDEFLWLVESVHGGGRNKLFFSLFSLDSLNFLDTVFHQEFIVWDESLWNESNYNQYNLSLIGVDTTKYFEGGFYYTEKTFDLEVQKNTINLVIDSVIVHWVDIPDPNNEFSHRKDTLVRGERVISNIQNQEKYRGLIFEYVSEMIDGYEYRTEKNCSYSEYKNEYSFEDIRENSPAFSICKTDTMYIEDVPIIIKWKEHEWNKPSQSIKGWDTTYPKGTYFTWWGCIDSIITPNQSLYNPARYGQLPFYQSIKVSFREIDSNNTSEDLLVISIKEDNGKGWSGVSFVQKANGLFDPAVPSYSEWVDNRMKLIISE